MAKSGERRMLFDIRGKRRHVIRAVYAVLAVLMAGSLFLVVGPLNVGELFGGGSSGGNGAGTYEERALRLERQLRKNPQDAKLLFALTRTRVNASNSLYTLNSEGQPEVTEDALHQLQLARDSWARYLKATDEPAVSLAQLMASSLIALAQNPSTPAEAEESLEAATEAQKLVTSKQPSLNSVTTLAFFTAYLGEAKKAKQIAKGAYRYTHSKAERDSIDRQLKSAITAGGKFQEYVKQSAKLEKKEGKEQKGRLFESESPLGAGASGSPVP